MIKDIIEYLKENEIPILNSNCKYYETKEDDYIRVAESIVDDVGDDLKQYIDSYIEKNLFFDLA